MLVEPLKRRTFALNTAFLALILLLQLSGVLDGINKAVMSEIPLVEGAFMTFLTALGGNAALGAFVVLVLLSDVRKDGRLSRETLAFLLALIAGLFIVASLKVLIGEPRPRPLPSADFLSEGAFPSGHTFRAAMIAAYVSDRWKKLAPLAWTYAVGIALTRLLLHYHWPSDVLFSLFLAPWVYSVAKAVVGVRR